MFHNYLTRSFHPTASRSRVDGLQTPAYAWKNLCKFWVALLVMVTPIVSLFAQERKVPIDIKITVNKSIPITGNEVQVTMEVTPLVAIKSAKASFNTSENIGLSGQKEFVVGPLNENGKKVFTAKATLTANGRGIVTGSFEIVTKEGHILGASRAIYFLINKGNTFYGQGSFVSAQSDSIKYKLKSARLTPEGYEQEYKKALKKAVNGSSLSSIDNKTQIKTNAGAKVAAVTTFIVSGTVTWTTRAPTSIQPVKFATVEIWDSKSNTLLGADITDASGFYFKTISADNPDIYIKTFAKSSYFFIVPQGFKNDESMTYFDTSPIISNVSSSTTLSRNIPHSLTEAKYNAFSIHSALVESAEYIANLNGGTALPKISVEFPGDANNSKASFYQSNNLSILNLDRFDWDVLHHEYGHYVQEKFNIADLSASDDHGPSDNLADRYSNKVKGFKIAWNEAWASYFGISLQQARSLNIPAVGAGNRLYEDTEDATLFWGLESASETTPPYPSLGEDNELAVQRILWDLYDGVDASEKDEVALGDAKVWDVIKNQHPTELYDIWTPFTLSKPMSEVVKYGAIFAEHKVASLPTAPTNGTLVAALTNPVVFTWDANGAGPSFKNNIFTVEFYNKDFSKPLFTSPQITTTNTLTASFTASPGDLKTIFATESEVNWIVKSSNIHVPAPPTGPYTSPAFTLKTTPKADIVFVVDDTGSMGEEIAGVRQGIISYLNSFSTSPTSTSSTVFQLVTFKDNYTIRPPTTDLTVIRSQVAALIASGGNDCPEASIEALIAVNDLVKDGGDVRLYTDADPHPGQSKESVVALYSKRGIKQSTLLSGTCSGATDPVADGRSFPPSDNKDGTASSSDVSLQDAAIDAYSYIAQQTGGIFVYFPNVNSGNPADVERYKNLVFNLIVGSISSAVTLIEPFNGPVGSTLTLTITGTNTNFNASSSVAFAGGGITVGTPTVLSATSMQVPITIAPSASLGFRDVTITTTLVGGGTETAKGVGLFSVIVAPTGPTVVGITPPTGSTGQTLTVTVSGLNTNFTNSSVLDMGSGITILNRTAITPSQLQAEIKIADNATVGFRNVSVTTGAEVATENVTGPFLVTTAGCSPISISSVVIPSGGTATLTASGCSGTLLWSTGESTSTIMIGPLTEGIVVSATCTTGACVVAAIGTVTVTPAGSGSALALTAPTYNCATGAFTFNTSGGDGSPITYFAIGITGPTTNPNQFVDTELRTSADAPPITLSATQNGVTVTYSWNIRAVCPLTPGGGSALALTAPTYNCATGAFIFNTSGGDGSPITYFAIGITGPTTNPNQFVDEGLRTAADAPLITLTATQNGVTVTYSWNIRAVCPLTPGGGSALALTAPTYNCATGAFTFNTSGGDGSPIEYRAVPGITGWTTNPNQFVDEGSRTASDVQPFLLQARQSGVTVTYLWDLKVACGRARMGASEPVATMQVLVRGNPLSGETVEVDISGIEGQPLHVQLNNLQGQLITEQRIKQAASIEQVRLQLSRSAGVYLLQVSTPGQMKIVRVLKVN